MTWNASVGYFEVGLELGVAAGCFLKERIWNSQRAMTSAGAAHHHDVDDVGVASDEPEIGSHAASDAHPTVARRPYHYCLVVAAFGFEYFGQTVISCFCNGSTTRFSAK